MGYLRRCALRFCSLSNDLVLIKDQRPLRTEELKEALRFHYELEGDKLLSDGQSFPYSDKDIELVCGSLVVVRNGTLQVIHLTVKEYLGSLHESESSPYSELLVDPGNASLQLTLVCLKCIRTTCARPLINTNSKTRRIDLGLHPQVLMKHHLQNPFTEYDIFSWMIHLTDCTGESVLEIARAFQQTFESATTFVWTETCLSYQPHSILRLIFALDEILDWTSDLQPDCWPEKEPGGSFLARWCMVMREVFQEYGTILTQCPQAVHFLDLQTPFDELEEFYEKYGGAHLREVTLYLDQYQSPHLPHVKPVSHRQLQPKIRWPLLPDNGIFFVHDEERQLYFWRFREIEVHHQDLFVQNAITGQRLPSVVNLSECADEKGSVQSFTMSKDGRYIAIVYNTWAIGEPSSGVQLTVIWHIDEKLKFRRMRCEPWARVITAQYSNSGIFRLSPRSAAFTNDGYCLTPSSKIDLASRISRPLSEGLIDRLDILLTSFYSGNGIYLFVSETNVPGAGVTDYSRITRYTPLQSDPPICYSWNRVMRGRDVSPTGRYLVLSDLSTVLCGREMHFGGDMEFGDESLSLYDTEFDRIVELPYDEQVCYWKARFFFSKEETELTLFVPWKDPLFPFLHLAVWTNFATGPELKTCGKLALDKEIKTRLQIHVNKNCTSALMITNARIIQRIEFGTSINFLDVVDVSNEYPCSRLFISRNGTRGAFLSYGRKKARLQLLHLTPNKTPARLLDLTWSPCDNPSCLLIEASSDLRFLLVGSEIFDIAEPNDHLASVPFTIDGLPQLLKRHLKGGQRPSLGCIPCEVSECSACVLYSCQEYQLGRREVPSRIYVFRIDVKSRSSTRVNFQLPQHLVASSGNFHPSLPLLTLNCAATSSIDIEDFPEKVPLWRVFLVNLENLDMKFLNMPVGSIITRLIEQ